MVVIVFDADILGFFYSINHCAIEDIFTITKKQFLPLENVCTREKLSAMDSEMSSEIRRPLN